MEQIRIDFEASLPKSYASCRDYVAALVHQQGKLQKTVAADMDLSSSDLSRKLAPEIDERRKFTLDDLESFIAATGDTRPIMYLVAKYLVKESPERIAELEAELARLKSAKPRAA